MRTALAFLCVMAVIGTASPTAAQTSGIAEVEAARQALREASEGLARAKKDQEKLAALGEAVRAQELALAGFRAGLRAMRVEEQRMLQDMAAQHAKLGELLGALQSLSRAPKSALLVFPGGPVEAARAARLLADITPELERGRIALAAQIDRLDSLRAYQETASADARETLAALQELRATTATQIDRRRPKIPNRAAFQEQAEAAKARARDLDQLSTTLQEARIETAPRVSFDLAKGAMPAPVAGTVTARFGDTDPWGRAGLGLTFTAPAWAEVTAPWDGTLRFAGELIDYGQVVVLEPQNGWMIIIAGLTNVNRQVGDQILMGERLGDLGGSVPSGEEFLREVGKDTGQISEKKLYIEVRHHGEPVDPAAWLANQGERSSN